MISMHVLTENVIIVGYPKSGNTWITRLTAELLGCPIVGFWNEPENPEIACEGLDRLSKLKCFKAHHTRQELNIDVISNKTKIIYVIRDPRDVVISGAHFFEFDRFPAIRKFLDKFPFGKSLYDKIIYKIIHHEQCNIEQMMKTILMGSKKLSWCHVPWTEHYKSYLNSPVLFIRYEDMLHSPVQQCLRILQHLNEERDLSFIQEVVKRQSFEQKKLEFKQKKEKHKVMFMRSGQSGEWRKKLSAHQKDKLSTSLTKDLQLFAYDISP